MAPKVASAEVDACCAARSVRGSCRRDMITDSHEHRNQVRLAQGKLGPRSPRHSTFSRGRHQYGEPAEKCRSRPPDGTSLGRKTGGGEVPPGRRDLPQRPPPDFFSRLIGEPGRPPWRSGRSRQHRPPGSSFARSNQSGATWAQEGRLTWRRPTTKLSLVRLPSWGPGGHDQGDRHRESQHLSDGRVLPGHTVATPRGAGR